MALIIEDGTKVSGANSYISAVEATEYVENYTDSQVWPTDEVEQEKALRMACQALELNWGDKYASMRTIGHQDLLWPRYTFYDANGRIVSDREIPVEIKKAQVELALVYLDGVDIFNRSVAPSISEEKVKIDVIETTKKYATGTEDLSYSKIEMLLKPILKCRKATRIVR